jgi:hypothetical protein
MVFVQLSQVDSEGIEQKFQQYSYQNNFKTTIQMAFTTPPPPPFPATLTLATSANLQRIAIVAAKGFYSSQVFMFERPLHSHFPNDTIEDYHRAFAERIKSKDHIVVIAEDVVDKEEKEGIEGQKVVVGVCCWQLPDGSRRVGQFQPPVSGLDCMSYCLLKLFSTKVKRPR